MYIYTSLPLSLSLYIYIYSLVLLVAAGGRTDAARVAEKLQVPYVFFFITLQPRVE